MKTTLCLVAVLSVLSLFSEFASAKQPSNSTGAGIPGVVREVRRGSFVIDLEAGGFMRVYVSPNTRFELDGKKSDASHVKEGAHVRVAGTTIDGSKLEAVFVNVISEPASN